MDLVISNEELLKWEKKRFWGTIVLIIIMASVGLLIVFYGLSPCEKCKLRIWETNEDFRQELVHEVSCLDIMRNYTGDCLKDIFGTETNYSLTIPENLTINKSVV